MSRETAFEKWLKETGKKIDPCNCGGPQDETDHSPDCDWVLSAEDLWKEFKHPEEYKTCPECNGDGSIEGPMYREYPGAKAWPSDVECLKCKGTGVVNP